MHSSRESYTDPRFPRFFPPDASTAAVGTGQNLEIVTARVLEVDPAAAVARVDLPGPQPVRIRPVLELALPDPAEDLVEFSLTGMEW